MYVQPFTVSAVASGTEASNFHPFSPMKWSTTFTEITLSRPFNRLTIRVLCAQGQASETYKWYRPAAAGNPLLPSLVIQFRKLEAFLTNSPLLIADDISMSLPADMMVSKARLTQFLILEYVDLDLWQCSTVMENIYKRYIDLFYALQG